MSLQCSAVGEGVALGRWTAVAEGRREHGHGPAGRLMAADRGLREAVGRDRNGRVSSPRPSTLTRPCLWTRPASRRVSGVTTGAVEGLEGVEVDDHVLDAERVLEPLELRDALLQGQLAALEAGLDVACGPSGPWCRGRRSCRPCRRCHGRPGAGPWTNPPVRSDHGPSSGNFLRAGTCSAPSGATSTVIRWGTRAIMPRISGRSGRTLDCPMPRSPRARRVPRCLGLVPMPERTWVIDEELFGQHLRPGITPPRWERGGRARSPGRPAARPLG